jgi:hypothetical protein
MPREFRPHQFSAAGRVRKSARPLGERGGLQVAHLLAMRKILGLLLLACACGPAPVEPKGFDNPSVSGCGDFFVVFLSSDKRAAITVQIDRKAANIGQGVTQVDASKATVKIDQFSRALTSAGEHYCTDVASGLQPTSTTVPAASIKVTLDHAPAQTGETYPLNIEVKDVNLGAGIVVPTLTGTNLSVGWFAG